MDELLLKHLRGQASEFESRQVQRWIEESNANRRRYAEARQLHRIVDAAPQVPVGPPPRITEIVDLAERRRHEVVARAGRRAFLGSGWFRYGLAAAAVLATILVVRTDDSPVPAGSRLTPVESAMGQGDVNTITLSDGSVIRAAPLTRLEFPPAAGRREVVLEGRAFFAVARDDAPFVVRTRAGNATVLGTRFEVSIEDDELRLVVVEGRVRVEGDAGAADVAAGHVAWLRRGSAPRVVARDDIWPLLDWEFGLMIFHETPLSEVAREIGRHFHYDIHLDDDDLRRRRITAWFGDESIDEVVSAICLIAGARCSLTNSRVTIEP